MYKNLKITLVALRDSYKLTIKNSRNNIKLFLERGNHPFESITFLSKFSGTMNRLANDRYVLNTNLTTLFKSQIIKTFWVDLFICKMKNVCLNSKKFAIFCVSQVIGWKLLIQLFGFTFYSIKNVILHKKFFYYVCPN